MLCICFVLFAGYGRFKNQDYRVFLGLLEETKIDNSEENKVCLWSQRIIFLFVCLFFCYSLSCIHVHVPPVQITIIIFQVNSLSQKSKECVHCTLSSKSSTSAIHYVSDSWIMWICWLNAVINKYHLVV